MTAIEVPVPILNRSQHYLSMVSTAYGDKTGLHLHPNLQFIQDLTYSQLPHSCNICTLHLLNAYSVAQITTLIVDQNMHCCNCASLTVPVHLTHLPYDSLSLTIHSI